MLKRIKKYNIYKNNNLNQKIMHEITIYSKQNKKYIKLECASSFLKKLLGLMGKKRFDGLIFKQRYGNRFLSSIHTCFMRMPIDLIYINREMYVQETITLNPWKIYLPKKGNIKYIIELPKGSINKYDISLHTKISIE